MYNENQLVSVKWNNTNKAWYESKGYVFTKRNDEFEVCAKDLSIHSSARIKAVCDYCGNEYETQFAMLTKSRKSGTKDCCPYCTGVKSSELSKLRRAKSAFEKIHEKCKQYGYKMVTQESDYVDMKMDFQFICQKHGLQTMSLVVFLRDKCECIQCSYEKRGKKLSHNINFIEQEIRQFDDEWLNPLEYRGANIRNLKIRCSCGNEYVTSYSSFKRRKQTKCFSCSNKESSGESIIREFLEKHNINFEQEKRFNDCCDKKPLPFDFYIPEMNIIIEFDGQHHYQSTYGQNYFDTTVSHDKIKNEYCQSHNIRLIRIPYWEGNNIEQIISEAIGIEYR